MVRKANPLRLRHAVVECKEGCLGTNHPIANKLRGWLSMQMHDELRLFWLFVHRNGQPRMLHDTMLPQ